MPLRSLLCLLNRHKPTHRRIRWDGAHRASTCYKCGAHIVQDDGRWVRDPEAPAHP